MKILKRQIHTPLPFFLLPILFSLALFSLFTIGCQNAAKGGSGTIKLLFTSEVGGRLDPCG